METRARYVLIGAFTLAAMAALLGFLLWLARVEISRSYAQYDIVFDTVSGLSQDSLVRYNGVDVGTVLSIDLDRDNPQFVRVRIEIRAATPVRQDTVATLSSQGVTGVSFVGLEGGSPMSEPIVAMPPSPVPVITSRPSAVQELTDAAPDLLKEAIALIEDVRQFATPENRESIAAILNNLEDVTARVDSLTVRAESFLTSSEATLARTNTALAAAEAVFTSADLAIQDIPALVDTLEASLIDVGDTAAELRAFTRAALPQYLDLATDARQLVATISAVADRFGRDAGRFLLGNQTPEYRN